MKNKIILIFAAYMLLPVVGLVSCNDCHGPLFSKYKTISLDWHNYKVNYFDYNNTNLSFSEIENNSVLYSQYALVIKPRQETYAENKATESNFSLIQAVYACDPVVIPTTIETIDSIVITSTKDFNERHRAGANLSGLFDVVVTDRSKKKYALTDYIASKPLVPQELTLILKEQPQLTTDFEFLVKFYQDGVDTDYFEFSTNRIVIKRD